jgi:hypothetical protein
MQASPDAFGRIARIVVGTRELVKGDASSGLRVVFSVEKSLKPEPNKAEIKIYNLAPASRKAVEQDDPTSTKKVIPVQIDAGYAGTGVSTIFLGNLREAFSTSEGSDVVTTISSGDGNKAVQHSQTLASFPKGTPILAAVQRLANDLGVGIGNLGELFYKFRSGTAVFSNGATLTGSSAWELTTLLSSLGKEWSIQDGKLQILDRGKTLAKKAFLLNANTGLVETPSINNKGELKAKTLMLPDVVPGRLLVLDSKHIRGNFRIEKTKHSGDTHDKDWNVEIDAKKL